MGSRPGRGNSISKESFSSNQETGTKLVRFSLLKCRSIPNSKNSEIPSPRGEV